VTRAWRLGVAEATRLADPWAAAAVYVLLAGGLMAGTFVPELRLLTGATGVVVLVDFIRGLGRRHDALDLAAALALLLVAVGTLFSTQPRPSAEILWFALVVVATFIRLRRLFADAGRRDRLLAVAGRIGMGVAVVVAALWIWESVDWVRAAGPGTIPPAGLDYSDDWLRNINVIPIYLVLLAPALVYCWAIRGERLLALVGLSAMTIVTVLSASRTAWLGIAVGIVVFAATGISWRRVRLSRRRAIGLGWVITAAVLLSIASGLAASLLEGVGDFATVRSRTVIWEAAMATWRAHPLTGAGLGTITGDLLAGGLAVPGSGPAPHAHSMPIQLLAEAGLIGAAAWLAIIVTVAWQLVRRRAVAVAVLGRRNGLVRGAALGALVAFLVDGLGDNHTALSAIDLLAVANVALLLPADTEDASRGGRWVAGRNLLGGLLALVAAGMLAWGLAAVAWGRAQDAVQRGDTASAAGALQLAVDLDPGMALYQRELGKLDEADGDAREAQALLEGSARANPDDPNTPRTLGVLAMRNRDHDRAIAYLAASVRLDGTDPDARILLGMALDAVGRSTEADAEYATAILLVPQVALSDGWSAIGVAPDRLERATERALAMASASPVDAWPGPQRVPLLAVLGRRTELRQLLGTSPVEAGRAWLALAEASAGNADEARRLLDASISEGRRSFVYWGVRAQVMALLGDAPEEARAYRLGAMLRESVGPPAGEPPLAAPIMRDANDFWMYQRSTAWFTDSGGPLLPSAARGAWLVVHAPERIELARRDDTAS
jgi:O-antigen ligase/tetratricopeptide (TPR) repeat protein